MTAPKPCLRDVEARAEAATEGPWVMSPQGPHRRSDVRRAGEWGPQEGITYDVERDRDATFIAASRTDVPALTAAIRAVLEVEQDLNYGESTYKQMRALYGTDYAAGWEAAEVAIGMRLLRALEAHIDLEES